MGLGDGWVLGVGLGEGLGLTLGVAEGLGEFEGGGVIDGDGLGEGGTVGIGELLGLGLKLGLGLGLGVIVDSPATAPATVLLRSLPKKSVVTLFANLPVGVLLLGTSLQLNEGMLNEGTVNTLLFEAKA